MNGGTKIALGVILGVVLAFSVAGISYYFPSSNEQSSATQTDETLSLPSFSVTSTKEAPRQPIYSMYFSTKLSNITLREDGTIEPQDAPIQRDGDVYTLIDDVVNRTVRVERDNVVIDGAGHSIQGFITNARYAADGIVLQDISNVTLMNMEVTQFWSGVSVTSCSDITITGTNVTDIGSKAIMFDSCNSIVVSDNTVDNVAVAIEIGNLTGRSETVNSMVARNSITNAAQGITMDSSFSTITENSVGNIYLQIGARGNQTTISKNRLVNGISGIMITGSNYSVYGNSVTNFSESGITFNVGANSSIYENDVSCSESAIIIRNSGGSVIEQCTFYHNNFVNNTQTVQVESPSSQNYWDNGSEGNYWSNYNETDSNGDGVGDISYVIDDNNIDRYPLMSRYETVQQSNQLLWVHLGILGLAAFGVIVMGITLVSGRTKSKPTSEK
ncbi:MAG: hypothetical protein CW691_10035 [Candidatus Bathyarchaeum sp.]|nr:MAG: hypothetical protein CW691_10035 [Candidatus Bathyarchaeum sp.]